MFFKKNKKVFIISILVIFLFVFNFSVLFIPKQAKAQLVVTNPAAIIQNISKWAKDQIEKRWEDFKENMVAQTFKNVARKFLNKIAYDWANKIATGQAGQGSLFEGGNVWDNLGNLSKAAGAEFINDIAKGGLGLDLCKPSNPKLNLTLQLSLYDTNLAPEGPKPDCSFAEMGERWGKLADELSKDWGKLVSLNEQDLAGIGFEGDSANQARLSLVRNMLSPKQSDTYYAQDILTRYDKIAADRKEAEKLEKEINDAGSLTAPRDTITGDLKQPSAITETKVKETVTINMPESPIDLQFTGNLMADAMGVFMNTLVSKGIEKSLMDMFKSEPGPTEYEEMTEGGGVLPFSGESFSAKDYIDQIFSQINKLSYNMSPSNIDVISEMEIDLRGDGIVGLINNGTIDANFSQALRDAQAGEPITLREAMTRYGWENKWFGFVDVGSQNVQQPKLEDGFSYDNMKILRKNRIVPVGWEMAALKIKSSSGNISECRSYGCTLETVLNQYDRTGTYAYIVGGEILEFQNDYCGWRPIALEPYNINIANSNACYDVLDATSQNHIDGVEVKWDGSDMGTPLDLTDDIIPGYCYKYNINENGFIKEILIEANTNQDDCEDNQPTDGYFDNNGNFIDGHFYEWEPGGCMIIEKDELEYGQLCGLVNPDWVLKAPPQQCGTKGYYSALSSPDSADRYQECADVQHCIAEDENGNCLGAYDYCTKEENIWRFKGEICSDYYSSCLTLKDDQGEIKSYLSDTLKVCNETQVGCRDYLIEKELIDGIYDWKIDGDKVYLNNNAAECDNEDGGCTEFIEIKPGVNLIPNGGLEINEDRENIQNANPDGWDIIGIHDYLINSDECYQNSSCLKLFSSANEAGLKKIMEIIPGANYTFSAYVKYDGEDTNHAYLQIKDCGNDASCLTGDWLAESTTTSTEVNWTRISTNYTFSKNTKYIKIFVGLNLEVSGANAWIDRIQLELNNILGGAEGVGTANPSSYKDYGLGGEIYFKNAPDYYNCDTNYIEECNDFVKYCSAADVGCELYAPVNNDPFVPAVLKSNDLCVAECNNYQTFVENPSYFDILEDATILPIDKNFIADTAKNCPAGEASCELFTNIDALEKGAEAREYYSFIRQCVKPDEVTAKLFYTWEGSDTSAFQLKTWKLLESTYSTGGGYAPCTNVELGGILCLDNVDNVVECEPSENFDCRTFYDENAIPHNRLLSKTIPITEECINLRRENSDQIYKTAPSMSRACSADNVGCLAYEGNNSNNIRNIFIEEFELGSISGWMAEDGAGNSINTQHSNESIYYNGHSMKAWVNTATPEIILSYNLTQNFNIKAQDIKNKKYSLSFWAKSFGNNDGETNVSPVYNGLEDNFIDFDQGLSVASPGWLFYKYDPIAIDTIISGKDVILKFKIKINNNAGQANDGFYIDNIILKEISSDFYKIKNSWNTPRTCSDNNYLGCQEYKDRYGNNWYIYQFSDLCAEEDIGCTAMINTRNSSMPFQQTFNAFCGEGSPPTECDLGRYYYKNNEDVLNEDENIVDSTIIVPKDELVYIVKDKTYSCLADKKGCQSLGVINNEGGRDDFYKLNDPDKYISDDYYGGQENTLCLDEDKNCTSFSLVGGSGVIYRIHPRNLTCTYQDDPQSNIEAGFYTDDGQDCTGLLYNVNYGDLTSSIAEDWKPFPDYSGGYAALCEQSQNKCSSFIDPLDNQDMLNYLYSQVGIQNLNFKNITQWRQASWDKNAEIEDEETGQIYYGEFSDFTHEGISINVNNEEIRVNLKADNNVLIYKGPESGQDAFDFYVEAGSIYRLSADIKLTDVQSVNVLLSCKQAADNNYGYLYSNNSSKIPYAFPAIGANYYTGEDIDGWQNIYGLYKILPGANYCNIAFYINGDTGDNVIIKDINFSKVTGQYNYLDDDNLDKESCNSPDLEEGCVLFHNTADSNLQYNSTQAYNLGEQGANDSNILLKVVRDRECSEWVTCGASLETFNKASGQLQDSCISLIGCDELSEAGSGLCSHPFSTGSQAQPLTLDYYLQMRGQGTWFDDDYSGYSIPGLYPLDSLVPVEIEEDVYDLGHLIVKKAGDVPHVYKTGIGLEADSAISGDYKNYNNWIETKDKTCRLYPEADSPFPWTSNNNMVLQIDSSTTTDNYVIFTEKASNFKNANICQPNFIDSGFFNIDYSVVPTDMNCECHYTIADYGAEKLFYPYDYDIDDIPTSIAPSYGYDAGADMKLKSTSKNLGWKGFCLEDDNSLLINNTNVITAEHRCLSWYPVDIISGEMDAYAVNPEATVNNLVGDNAKLCAISEDWTIKDDRFYCAHYSDTQKCNVIARIPAGTKAKTSNLNEDTEKILMGKETGRTWLTKDDSNLTFKDSNETDTGVIIINNKHLSIIYGSTNNEPGDDNNTGLSMNESYKYGPEHFHWDFSEGDSDDIQDDLKNIFDTKNNKIELYFWDERVDCDGNNITGVLEDSPLIHLAMDNGARSTGAECGDECPQAISEADFCSTIDDGNYHQIRIDCDKNEACGLGGCWRDAERECNPLTHNYYVNNPIQEALTFTIHCGSCLPNCKGGDKGLQCLENEFFTNNHYNEVLTIYNNNPGDIGLCKDEVQSEFGLSESQAENDCKFVECIDDSNISNPSANHLCDSYKNSEDYACSNFIRDSQDYDLIISSSLMNAKYERCLISDAMMYPGYPLEGIECNLSYGCNDHTCEECVSYIYIYGTPPFSYENLSNPGNCDPDCIQTCQTYMDISKATFDSNNFYLNWLSINRLVGLDEEGNLLGNPCVLSGNNLICPKVINSSIAYYGTETWIRYVEILQGGIFEEVIKDPFSAVADKDELRSMALRYDNNPVSYDYYSPKDSLLSVSQGNLEKLLIKVPDADFQEYQEGTWINPDWAINNCWNETGSGSAPIVKAVEHDIQSGFYEGVDGISINNQTGQHIEGVDGDLYAYLSFYAYAVEGQAPLSKIEIDWTGLGNNKLVLEGPFENHKPNCERRCGNTYKNAFIDPPLGDQCISDSDCVNGDSCFAKTWGDTEYACVEDNQQTGEKGFFAYSYIYTCDPLNDYWQWDCSTYGLDGGCCVYKPEVVVHDNWGQTTTANLSGCNGVDDYAIVVSPR